MQLVRQWRIVQLLARGTRLWSVREIATELATSKSTVARDLATIEQVFPLYEENEGRQRVRYRIDGGRLPGTASRIADTQLKALEKTLVAARAGRWLDGPTRRVLGGLLIKLRGSRDHSDC
jgi:predicted DNA-binding transcriptional regulator YafY